MSNAIDRVALDVIQALQPLLKRALRDFIRESAGYPCMEHWAERARRLGTSITIEFDVIDLDHRTQIGVWFKNVGWTYFDTAMEAEVYTHEHLDEVENERRS